MKYLFLPLTLHYWAFRAWLWKTLVKKKKKTTRCFCRTHNCPWRLYNRNYFYLSSARELQSGNSRVFKVFGPKPRPSVYHSMCAFPNGKIKVCFIQPIEKIYNRTAVSLPTPVEGLIDKVSLRSKWPNTWFIPRRSLKGHLREKKTSLFSLLQLRYYKYKPFLELKCKIKWRNNSPAECNYTISLCLPWLIIRHSLRCCYPQMTHTDVCL